MGCGLCKSLDSLQVVACEQPLRALGRSNHVAIENKNGGPAAGLGSATTLAASCSPSSINARVRGEGSPAYPSGDPAAENSSQQTSSAAIKRQAGRAIGAEDLTSAANGLCISVASRDRGNSDQPGAPDVSQHKAPSYRVRKSIVTARVRLGSTSQFFDKYEVTEEVLGTGISGAVRVAIDKGSNRRYAIKTLNLENISPKKAAMLHNEVDIYLKLDHPNIAKLIEVYEDDKRIFLVMELCTGGELYDRLAARKRYHEADAARVTQQMLEAINYCHKHRICHRDLKLENWVYAAATEDAQLKLIDFGFSRIFNPVIPMTAMHGTVYYVSPEVMDGCYREKCDIWSIGVIVYMLLSGTPPFNGAVDYQILVKIRTASYNFDNQVWKTVSDQAKAFIRSLLVLDPATRPSAEEALKHPWLKVAESLDTNEIDVGVLQAMRVFALGNVMKRAALGLVAYSFTNDEVQYLYKDFKRLDPNKTGTIRLQDLVQALVKHLKLSHKEATNVFERIDQTGDREVHYTEFVAATLHARMLRDERWIRQAFDKLDVNNTGLITVEDLRAVLGNTFNNMSVEEMMSMCDPSGKGAVDYETFRAILTAPDEPIESGVPHPSLESRASFSKAIVSLQLANGENRKDSDIAT